MRFFSFFTILFLVLALVYFVVGVRTIMPLTIQSKTRIFLWTALAFLWLLQLIAPFAYRRVAPDFPQWLQLLLWIAYGSLGFFTLAFFFALLTEPLHLALLLKKDFNPERRHFLLQTLSWSTLAIPGLFAFAGFLSATRTPKIFRVSIPLKGKTKAISGFKIAQISDIHIGPTLRRDYLENIVTIVNSLGANIIAVTGDIVDGTVEQLREQLKPLSRLKAPHGVYFVTGNHEYYWNAPAWTEEMRSLGLDVLLNEHRMIPFQGENILLAGITDPHAVSFVPEHASDPQKAMGNNKVKSASVLLAHQPSSCYGAEKAGFDMMLCGHTHGGQFWPFRFIVDWAQPYLEGLNLHGKMWVYVNRGTGYWGPPLRLGVPSEISLLTLTNA